MGSNISLKTQEKNIDLGKHFSKFDLVKYSLPTMFMMLLVSLYMIIDGFFISNFVGSTAFAAVNLIWPLWDILGASGIMIGAGSSALIANKLGEKKKAIANQYLGIFFVFAFVLSLVLVVICLIIIRPLLIILGAEGEMLEIANYYGVISMIALPGFVIQLACNAWFNTAGRPNVGFLSSLIVGLIICGLDYLLVAVLNFGIDGILIATICGQTAGAVFPAIYFIRKDNLSLIHFKLDKNMFKVNGTTLSKLCLRACINGSGEAIQQMAMALVSFLCLYQINVYSGEEGVVAYGVIEYCWILFNSLYIGYALATAPIMSYQQGAKNLKEMKILFKNSLIVISIMSGVCFLFSFSSSMPVAQIFVGYDQNLTALTNHALRIFSFAYLFCGISIYGSNFFMSIGRGLVGALIAIARSFLFETSGLLLLPLFLGLDGIFLASAFAEIFASFVAIVLFVVYRNKFLY